MPKPHALLRAGFPYLKTIGRKGITNHPTAIAFGKEGRIYSLTWGAIKVTNENEEDLGDIGIRWTDRDPIPDTSVIDEGILVWPLGIAVDSQENIYVSDEGIHRISVWNSEGDFLRKWGELGSGDGQLDRPAGIAFSLDEDLYVVDSMNHRVQKFTNEGDFLMTWGSFGDAEGEFNMPWGVAVDADGDVYISDWRNDRIQKFTSDGEFIFSFGKSGTGDGQLDRPMGIALDGDYDIYVVDRCGVEPTRAGHNRVQLFSPEGRYVQKFMGDATMSDSERDLIWTRKRLLRLREMTDMEDAKRFRHIISVTVDDQGRMFVPDWNAYRIQVYQKESYQLEEGDLAPALRAPTLSSN